MNKLTSWMRLGSTRVWLLPLALVCAAAIVISGWMIGSLRKDKAAGEAASRTKEPASGARANLDASPAPVPPPLGPMAKARAEIKALEKESLEIAERLTEEFPDTADSLGFLGMVYAQLGHQEKARPCWEKALARDPGRGGVYGAMAMAALAKAEYEEALEICRTGLAKAKGLNQLHLLSAKALNGLGRPKEAVQQLELAIKDLPKDEDNYLLLGQTYERLNEYEKARNSFAAAVKLKPDDQRAYYGLATTCARLGLDEESQRAMKQYEERARESMQAQRSHRGVSDRVAQYRYYLATTCAEGAMICLRQQRQTEAEELLCRGIAVAPRNVPCRSILAQLLVNTHRESEAIPHVQELVAIEPQRAFYHFMLCQIHSRLRRPEEAIVEAKKAVELEPENPQYRRILGLVQEGK